MLLVLYRTPNHYSTAFFYWKRLFFHANSFQAISCFVIPQVQLCKCTIPVNFCIIKIHIFNYKVNNMASNTITGYISS